MADDGQFDAPSVDIASRYGTLKAPDWTDDLIVTALKLHGEWAESETELLSSLMDRDELFWDVGAFLGTFSLSLAGHIDLKRVVAVEANPAVQPFLRSNLEQNLKCDLSVEIGGVAASNGWIVPGKCDVIRPLTDQNLLAHSLRPIDMMRQGWLSSFRQASQQ